MCSQVVVDMVKTRLGAEDAQSFGWLLDGYPRSAEQAEAIEAVSIRPDIFILINVRASFLRALASDSKLLSVVTSHVRGYNCSTAHACKFLAE